MVELLSLPKKLQIVNRNQQSINTFLFYENQVYYTVYSIMRPYNNNSHRSYIATQEKLNKIIVKLQMKVKHTFAIH